MTYNFSKKQQKLSAKLPKVPPRVTYRKSYFVYFCAAHFGLLFTITYTIWQTYDKEEIQSYSLGAGAVLHIFSQVFFLLYTV